MQFGFRSLVLSVSLGLMASGCNRGESPAPAESQEEEQFEHVTGKSKVAHETCREVLQRMRLAFSEDGRSPQELNGTLQGGMINAGTLERVFGQPDRTAVERPDGKPTWYWFVQDGAVGLDVVEETEQAGGKLLKIGGVIHMGN